MDTTSFKNVQNGLIWRVFENLKLAVKWCYQPDISILIEPKIVENAQIEKTFMRHFFKQFFTSGRKVQFGKSFDP